MAKLAPGDVLFPNADGATYVPDYVNAPVPSTNTVFLVLGGTADSVLLASGTRKSTHPSFGSGPDVNLPRCALTGHLRFPLGPNVSTWPEALVRQRATRAKLAPGKACSYSSAQMKTKIENKEAGLGRRIEPPSAHSLSSRNVRRIKSKVWRTLRGKIVPALGGVVLSPSVLCSMHANSSVPSSLKGTPLIMSLPVEPTVYNTRLHGNPSSEYISTFFSRGGLLVAFVTGGPIGSFRDMVIHLQRSMRDYGSLAACECVCIRLARELMDAETLKLLCRTALWRPTIAGMNDEHWSVEWAELATNHEAIAMLSMPHYLALLQGLHTSTINTTPEHVINALLPAKGSKVLAAASAYLTPKEGSYPPAGAARLVLPTTFNTVRRETVRYSSSITPWSVKLLGELEYRAPKIVEKVRG